MRNSSPDLSKWSVSLGILEIFIWKEHFLLLCLLWTVRVHPNKAKTKHCIKLPQHHIHLTNSQWVSVSELKIHTSNKCSSLRAPSSVGKEMSDESIVAWGYDRGGHWELWENRRTVLGVHEGFWGRGAWAKSGRLSGSYWIKTFFIVRGNSTENAPEWSGDLGADTE